MDSYSITFSDIDVSLLQGSYSIKNVQVLESGSKTPLPLFTADALTYSLPFSYLSKGNFFCVLNIQRPKINFIRGPSPESSQLGMQHELVRLLKKLSPYPVDQFNVEDGTISFRDYHQTPRIEMEVSTISFTGTNLRNSQGLETLLPGKISGKGRVGGGEIRFHMDVNPLQNKPIFEMTTEVTGVDLTYLGGLMQSDYQINVDRGLLTLETETHSKDNVLTTRITRSLQNVQARRTRTSKASKRNTIDEKGEQSRAVLTSWRADEKTDDANQVLRAEVQNYKGNLLTLTGEALLGIFHNAVIAEIEKSAPRPIQKAPKKVMIAKSVKKEEKKNFLEKLFRKKEENEKDNKEEKTKEEGTVSASER
jgi:hypothetical protein